MLFGAGSLLFVSKELANNGSVHGEDLLYPPCLSSFELNGEANFLEAKCLVDGKIATVAAAINEEVYTFTVTTQFTDWQALQFAYDELSQQSANVVLPSLKISTVGADTADTIADADIVAGNLASVKVYVNSQGSWGDRRFLKVIDTGVPTVDEVLVAAGTLTFNSAFNGATVQYIVDKTYSSAETIGLESSFDRMGKLEFWGLAYGTEFQVPVPIRIPDLSRISIPTLSVNGDITELTVEFRANVDTSRGFRNQWVLYNELTV